MKEIIYDVAVIGAGPAGVQAAVSASHQMRHVLVLHSGKVSFSRGRAYWSKSVEIEDAPVFPGIIGPHFAKELMKWMESRPVVDFMLGSEKRKTGIDIRDGMVAKIIRNGDLFELEASTKTLKQNTSSEMASFKSRWI